MPITTNNRDYHFPFCHGIARTQNQTHKFVKTRELLYFGLICTIVLSACLPSAAASEPAVTNAEIKMHKGRPTIFINDEPKSLPAYTPRSTRSQPFFKNTSHFYPHQMGLYFVSPVQCQADGFGTRFWMGKQISQTPLLLSDDDVFQGIDDSVRDILKHNPDAYLMIRFFIHPPKSWIRLHKGELFRTSTGETPLNTPSLASDLYWNSAAKFCQALIKYVESRPWSLRVIGYANFQIHEGCMAPVGNGWLYDHSLPMRKAWHQFLRDTYTTDAALQKAYGDKTLTLENVPFPQEMKLTNVQDANKSLFWQAGPAQQLRKDYLSLQAQLFHKRYRQIASASHGAVNRKVIFLHDALKQTMQGWNLQPFFFEDIPWASHAPELMAGSGSMHVADLLGIPGSNGLITPHDYQARGIGGVFEPEGIVDSVVLRKQFFFCEMDTRTYEDKKSGWHYGGAKDDTEFLAITWRNIATALTRGFQPYWMDLYTDWFAADSMQPIIARQVAVLRESIKWPHETVPGIAMILDDSAPLETNGSLDYANEAILWEQKMGLARCGVPFRIYLLEDLALEDFPPHRVFYFPNLFRVNDVRLALLKQKVFRNGNVVLWGPGSGISDGKILSTTSAARLTGFSFAKMLRVNYPRRTLLTDFTHPITRNLSAATVLGGALSYGPLLFPSDGRSLGRAWTKQGRNYYGLAVKEFGKGAYGNDARKTYGAGDWASVFSTTVSFPAAFWRNLARWGGAHIYTESDDILLADASVVALHTTQAGKKTIFLPDEYKVTNLVTNEVYAKKTGAISFTATSPATYVFHLSKVNDDQ